MSITRKTKLFDYLERVLIFLVAVSLFFYINTATKIYLVQIQSDWLMPFQIFEDVFKNKLGISGWQFPGSPYFFPDIFGILSLYAITNSISVSTYIYYSLFFVLFLYLTYNLFLEILPSKKSALMYSLLTVVSIFYVVSFDDPAFTSMRFFNESHISVLAFSIFLLWSYLKLNANNLLKFYVYITYLVTYLVCLSDKLAILQAVIPIILTIFLQSLRERTFERRRTIFASGLCIAVGFSLITPSLLEKIFSISFLYLPSGCSNITEIFSFFLKFFAPDIKTVFHGEPVVICSYILCDLLSAIFLANFWLDFIFSKSSLQRNQSPVYFNTSFSITFFLSSQMINFLGVVWSCLFNAYPHFRYLLTFFAFPLFSVWVLLAYLSQKYESRSLYFRGLVMLLLLFYLTYFPVYVGKSNLQLLPDFAEPYPSQAQAMDKIASRYKLKSGVAEYWHSRFIEILAKHKLRIDQLLGSMHFARIGNNKRRWYVDPDTGQKPEYNFMIVNDIQPDTIKKLHPDIKVTSDNIEVWLFTKHEKELNEFLTKLAEEMISAP